MYMFFSEECDEDLVHLPETLRVQPRKGAESIKDISLDVPTCHVVPGGEAIGLGTLVQWHVFDDIPHFLLREVHL